MDSIAPKDWLSFGIGSAGLLLGIVNFIRSILADAPKVTVYQPPGSHFPEAGPGKPTILRIVNHRNRPVTIVDAGFLARERDDRLSIADHGAEIEPKFPITIPAGGFVEVAHGGKGLICHYSFARTLYGHWAETAEGKRIKSRC